MSFTIPNQADAYHAFQAEVDNVDLDILVEGHAGNGVVGTDASCKVTAQGSPDTTVAVAAGEIQINGAVIAITGGNVTCNDDAGDPRFYLICAKNDDTVTAVAGTPAAHPVFPDIPTDSVALAAVYVEAGDNTISTNKITDKRVFPQAESRSWPFFTAATGSGVISSKTYVADTVPSSKVLTAFESDNDDITVTIEIHGETLPWQAENVIVSGGGATPVTVTKGNWSQVGDSRIWTASVNLTDADTTGTLTATMSDGKTATCTYTRALDPPLILTLIWDSSYPASQTQFGQGQTLNFSGTTESHADEVYIKDWQATQGEGLQGPFSVVAGVFSGSVTTGNDDLATADLRGYAKVTGGTAGADFDSDNTSDHSQTVPTFSATATVIYSSGLEALKDAETCTVQCPHTNIDAGDTYLYTEGSGLDIPSLTTYENPKTGVNRGTEEYWESGTNFTLAVTRAAKNGLSASTTRTVRVAHTTPVITVGQTGGSPMARMGTDDGSVNYKDHTVFIISSQANLSTYTASVTLALDGADNAAFQGSWSASGVLKYSRAKRVEDGDILTGGQAANTHTWGALSVKNRAGKEATVVTTNTTYDQGGFAERTLTIAAWPNRTADLGVLVVATGSLTCENLSKGGAGPGGGTIFTYDASPGEGLTPDDEVDKFCIVDGSDLVDADHQNWYNKDQANAVSNSSGTATVLVAETA